MDEPISFEYVGEVNSSLECAICRTAFNSPMMAPQCQHIFCHGCVAHALELSPTCPIDRSPLRLEELVNAPRVVQQMVEELLVVCPNRSKGCRAECQRGLLEGHLREHCTARDAAAKGKGKETALAAEDDSTSTEVCEACQELLEPGDTSTHAERCPSAATTCDYCFASLVRSAIPTHNLYCPSIPIPCPHAVHGCPARHPRSQMLEEHLDVACPYEPIKDYLDQQLKRTEEVEDENRVLLRRCESLEDGMREMRMMMEGIKRGMGAFWTDSTAPLSAPSPPLHLQTPSLPSRRQSTDEVLDGFFDSDLPATSAPSLPPSQGPIPIALPGNSQHPSNSPHYPSPGAPPPPSSSFPFEAYYDSSSPALPSPVVPPFDPTDTSLSSYLSSIHSNLSTLTNTLSTSEARQTSALRNETLRTQDEMQSLRAVVHGMRMQMHHLLMEVGRSRVPYGPGGGMNMRGGVGGIGVAGGSGMGDRPILGGGGGSSEEGGSDDEAGGGGVRMPYMMSMGSGPRFFVPPPPGGPSLYPMKL